MKQHTVAVMGLGIRGKIHIHGLLGNPERFKIVGLCDIDTEKMKNVAKEYGLENVPTFTDAEQMLDKTRPEVFVFVTYPNLRLNILELGIKYGVKAISLEKPMAESLQEAKKMVELCREHGVKAVVCHQQKYLSQMQALKKRIDDGEIGKIRKIHVETQAWFSQLGTHYVDYMVLFALKIHIRRRIIFSEHLKWKTVSTDMWNADILRKHTIRRNMAAVTTGLRSTVMTVMSMPKPMVSGVHAQKLLAASL